MFSHASMNRIYRLVWSEVLGTWIAVAEHTRGRGKRSGKLLAPAVAALGMALGAQAAPLPAPTALPTGGKVVAGAATVTQDGAAMTVNQTTQRSAIDWQTFNLGSQASIRFMQPSTSSVTLNRVLDSQASQVMGKISANGQVFLTNPNGVYFGAGASADVGGLVATTHGISNADFMAGGTTFTRDGASGAVVNEGHLSAGLGGYIALLAPEVRNSGVIVAQAGTVALAAGEAIRLQFDGNNTLAGLTVSPATIRTLVENRQAVLAPGGQIILSAQAANRLQGGVVNNSGSLEANGLRNDGGRILLEASDRVEHSGSIHADGVGAGQGGQVTLIADLANPDSHAAVSGNISARGGAAGAGGFVETSGSHLTVADGVRVDTRAGTPGAKAGTWLLDPDGFTIAASGGDISGATLGANLASGDVAIASTSGSGSDGNVNVNDAVSWSANKLTLTATNNVNVNAVMSATGNASLDLEPTAGRVNTKLVNGTSFAGRVDFSGTGTLTIKNHVYTVINSLGADRNDMTAGTLQGVQASQNAYYALGSDIDATPTASWNSNGAIGMTMFSISWGAFDGLGHRIIAPTIRNQASLFYSIYGDNTVELRNVGVVGGSVIGGQNAAGLVGMNYGTISNAFSTMDVTGFQYTGGLVGENRAGILTNTYAGGTVSGQSYVGGLVGKNYGTALIENSFATGNVTGSTAFIGGLVGNNYFGRIQRSYATGNVTGSQDVGGLVGLNQAAGGTGSVIIDTYATGNVNGNTDVGGLVGQNASIITNSYAVGAVSINNGNTTVGGLVGYVDNSASNSPSVITNSFWDTQTTGRSTSAGGAGSGTGLTTAQMKTRATFTGAGWDFGTPVWQVKASANNGYPCLAVFASCPSAISLTVRVAGTQNSNVYGDAVGTFSYSLYNGATLLDANAIAALGLNVGGSASYANAPTTGTGAGSYTVSYAAGLTLGGVNADNYQLTPYAGFSYNVLKRPLTLTGTRSYDGTTAFGVASLSATNLVGSDCAGGLAACNLSGSASVGSKNVSAGTQALSFGSLSLTGSGLDANYTLSGATGTGVITPRSVTPVVTAGNRVYDGGTTAQASVGAGAALVSGDTLNFSFANAAFADKNAGTGKTVQVSGIALGGADAGNYALAGTSATGHADITPLALSVTASGVSRAYDGTVNDAATLASAGLVAGDAVTLSATSVFQDKNVGTGKTVNVSNIALGGADAQNYTLNNTSATTSADITPRVLQVGGSGGSRMYDGTTQASVTLSGTNQVLGDTLVLTPGAAALADKNAGINKAVNVTGITLGGADAGNYALAGTGATVYMTVTPRPIGVSATASDRVYDGSVNAPVALALGNGILNGDQLAVASSTAVFADKNVGTAKAVAVTNIVLGGTDARNYVLNNPTASASASITPRALTVSGQGVDRTYDGTTAAQVNLADDRIAGDVLALGHLPLAFADKNAGVNKPLAVTGITMAGADAGNYTLANVAFNTSAAITPRFLGLNIQASDRAYDGTTAVPVVVTGMPLEGDTVTVSATGAFANKNVGVNKRVTLDNVVLGGADAANYVAVTDVSGRASITPRALTVSASGGDKVYDGTTAAQVGLQLGGVVAGDQVSTAVAHASFADKNAGAGKAVTVSGIALRGDDAGNYLLESDSASTSATIAPRALTVALHAADRVYDGTTAVAASFTDDRLAGDRVTVGSAPVAFADKNAGTGKAIQATGIALAGADAGNYTLAGTTASTSATIAPRALAITASGIDRAYDGTTAVGVTLADDRVAGDVLTLDARASLADKNAGNAKPVTVSGIVAGGADAGNYTFARTGTASVNIAQRVLQVGASAADRTFDGTTKVTVRLSDNRIAGDSLEVGSDGASLADPLPGTGKAVTVRGLALHGADAANYRLADTSIATSVDIAADTQSSVPRLPVVDTTLPQTTRAPSPLTLLAGAETIPVLTAPAPARPPVEATEGITVTLVRAAAGKAAGMIAVDVPKQIISKGESFSFPLPQPVADALAVGGASASVGRPDASPLPAWLKYDAQSHTFDVSAAPANALPFEVKITVDGRSWNLVLAQGSGS